MEKFIGLLIFIFGFIVGGFIYEGIKWIIK